jgi:hypothetical protein
MLSGIAAPLWKTLAAVFELDLSNNVCALVN